MKIEIQYLFSIYDFYRARQPLCFGCNICKYKQFGWKTVAQTLETNLSFCFFWHTRRPQGCNDSGVKEILGRTPSVAKTRKWHFSPDWDVKSSWQVMVLVCMEKPAILTIVLFYGFFGASFFVKQSHQIQLKVNYWQS